MLLGDATGLAGDSALEGLEGVVVNVEATGHHVQRGLEFGVDVGPSEDLGSSVALRGSLWGRGGPL